MTNEVELFIPNKNNYLLRCTMERKKFFLLNNNLFTKPHHRLIIDRENSLRNNLDKKFFFHQQLNENHFFNYFKKITESVLGQKPIQNSKKLNSLIEYLLIALIAPKLSVIHRNNKKYLPTYSVYKLSDLLKSFQ